MAWDGFSFTIYVYKVKLCFFGVSKLLLAFYSQNCSFSLEFAMWEAAFGLQSVEVKDVAVGQTKSFPKHLF